MNGGSEEVRVTFAASSNPAVLLNFATTAVGLTRSDPPQLVLSSELANPTPSEEPVT